MLDRLERAFAERQASEDRLRRFIADASHELRTPLASIRGYAELFRMGAAREPDDVERAMRADRGRGGAHGRARRGPADARAPRRGRPTSPHVDGRPRRRSPATRSTTRAPRRPTATIELRVDAARRRHRRRRTSCARCSPTCCATRSSTRRPARRSRSPPARGRAACASRCATTGPGLPTGTTPDALFERFWRAEGGRERGRAGAGLGLAIVAGIVDAHGGARARRRTPPAAAPRSSCGCPPRAALRRLSGGSDRAPTSPPTLGA